MRAIAAYMANKTREEDRRNDYRYREPERRGTENRVYSAEHQPDQYPRRREMAEDWPEGNEMRRRRDSDGRYMTDYDGGAESRYRGRDGRWRAGRRRSEYDGGAYDNMPTDRRMEDEDEEEGKKYRVTVEPKNVIQWPYMPHIPPDSRMIGFGNRRREMPMSHYDGGRQEAHVGGTMWMQPMDSQHDTEKLDKQGMEKWVHRMKDDKNVPIEPWTVEEVKPLAARFGYPTSGDKFDDFYTALHMMKSDFCAVAEDFDVNTPAFYAAMAEAWLKDPDAALKGREKLEAHYKYIVMGKK